MPWMASVRLPNPMAKRDSATASAADAPPGLMRSQSLKRPPQSATSRK